MKYPLTPEAKGLAKELVDAWTTKQLAQLFYLYDMTSMGNNTVDVRITLGRLDHKLDLHPDLAIIRELAIYGLIDVAKVRDDRTERIEVTLLQELRNAVATDFDVSEFFLTLNAVGTIVHGDLTVQTGANYQSGASNLGDVQVTQLGTSFLESQADLKNAIDALRIANEADKQSKLGRVVSELGNSLQHTANATVVVGAIYTLAPYFMKLFGG
jgi:hypothetical protein